MLQASDHVDAPVSVQQGAGTPSCISILAQPAWRRLLLVLPACLLLWLGVCWALAGEFR